MIAGSKSLIRDLNTSNIIQTIVSESPISRADISKKTNLAKATVSTIVQNLLDMNIVVETSYEGKGVGRRSFLLELSPQSAHCISIDADTNLIKIMVSDLSGQKVLGGEKLTNPTSFSKDILSIIEEYNSKVPPSPFQLIGIALGVRLPWQNLNTLVTLKEEISSRYSVNTYIHDHSIFSVLGENAYSTKSDNIVFVNNLDSISMGFINKDRVLTNGNFSSYPLGEMVVGGDFSSTLNNLSSLSSILHLVSYEKNQDVNITAFMNLLKNHDPIAEKATSEFIKYMNIAIRNIIIFYHPDIIVLNCPLTLSDEIFLRLKNSLGEYKSILYRSVLNQDAALYGGAAHCIMDFLKINTFKPAKCYFKNLTFI